MPCGLCKHCAGKGNQTNQGRTTKPPMMCIERGGGNGSDTATKIIAGKVKTRCRRSARFGVLCRITCGAGLPSKNCHAGQSQPDHNRSKMEGKCQAYSRNPDNLRQQKARVRPILLIRCPKKGVTVTGNRKTTNRLPTSKEVRLNGGAPSRKLK